MHLRQGHSCFVRQLRCRKNRSLTCMIGSRHDASCSIPAAFRFTPSGIRAAWILPISPSYVKSCPQFTKCMSCREAASCCKSELILAMAGVNLQHAIASSDKWQGFVFTLAVMVWTHVLSHQFGYRAEQACKSEQRSRGSSTCLLSEGMHDACCR